MSRFAADSITQKFLDETLVRYNEHIPQGLEELDDLRFTQLPRIVADRRQEQSNKKKDEEMLLLTKDELIELVTWKLKHGTFRPRLLQLVKSNEESDVHRTIHSIGISDASTKEKLKILTSLKGIGPATASLVLSCIDPYRYPFFSDELFRWTHWNSKNAAGIKDGKGWKRPIGYTHKEYDSLLSKCEALQRNLDGDDKLSFLDLEKVAYVLGKENVDVARQSSTEPTPARKRSREVDQTETVLRTDKKRPRKKS